MVRKRNSVKFESSNISETGKAMPAKIVVHASTSKCINFLANSYQFYFYATMDGATNIVHVL